MSDDHRLKMAICHAASILQICFYNPVGFLCALRYGKTFLQIGGVGRAENFFNCHILT
jgi:hypothetical protein